MLLVPFDFQLAEHLLLFMQLVSLGICGLVPIA